MTTADAKSRPEIFKLARSPQCEARTRGPLGTPTPSLSFSIERWLPRDEDLLQSIRGTCDECFTGLSNTLEQDAEIAATRRNVAHNVIGGDLEACAECPL